ELFVRDDLGVEDDAHDLGVAGQTRADLTVGGIGRVAPGVADLGRVDALGLPELALGSPEAAHAEHGELHALGERLLQWGAVHEVALGYGHGLGAAGQG